MQTSRRRFRIEMLDQPVATGDEAAAAAERHRQILAALADIRKAVLPAEQVSNEIIEDYRERLAEARALRAELESIQAAINTTKLELAALHVGPGGRDLHRVTDELDAVVRGTEEATEQVLQAAECIDRDAADLAAALKKSANVDLVADIREQVIRVFEACNFQDLTGQRITKVVNTLRFVEERVERMMQLWGGLEAFVTPKPATQDGTTLNGPKLDGDVGHVSQDDIDALFD
jgi:chemotaxis protein CheZ